MGFWAALGTGGRAAMVAVGGVAAAGGGYGLWRLAQPAPVAEPAALVSAAPSPAVNPAAVVEAPVPEPEAVPPAEAALPELTVDTWRVAPDGAATVAGRTVPAALVRILVDAAPVAEVTATASGEFAALFTLAPNTEASLMTLVTVLADGTEVPAAASIALGPIAGPEVVAEAPAEMEVPAVETAGAEVPEAALPEPEPAAQPAAVLVTEEGAAVLQEAAAPDTVMPVTIDTITYTPSGAVQVGGRGEGGGFVRLYLDNTPLQTVLIPDSGQWFSTLKEVAPGLYQLRADQLDASGTVVTGRYEIPFKRESLEALAAAAAPPAEVAAEPEPPAPGPELAAVEPEPADVTAPEPPLEDAAPEPATAPEEPAPDAIAAQEPVATAAAPEPAPPPVTVTVQPGHTLWAIAKGELGEGVLYVQVYEANREAIKDPDMIFPGQVFTIPSE